MEAKVHGALQGLQVLDKHYIVYVKCAKKHFLGTTWFVETNIVFISFIQLEYWMLKVEW